MKKTTSFFLAVCCLSAATSVLATPPGIKMHRPGHYEDLGYLTYTYKDFSAQIFVLKNNSETPKGDVGFSLALIPVGDKYIPIAYDIVPLADHENAEVYVMRFASHQLGLAELPMEHYSDEVLGKAESFMASDMKLSEKSRKGMLLVLRQSRAYLKTEYFALVYKDGDRIRSSNEVDEWISKNILPKSDASAAAAAARAVGQGR
jgi:hypothetical protein